MSAQVGSFTRTVDLINSAQIQYGYNSPFISGNNSNSAVWTAIVSAGLGNISIPQGIRAPGMQDDLRNYWEPLSQNGGGGHCFPSDTPIQLTSGESTPIQSIRPGDNIAAFNGKNFRGRGELESRPVVQLFENITDTWIKLSFAPSAVQKGEDSSLVRAAEPENRCALFLAALQRPNSHPWPPFPRFQGWIPCHCRYFG